MKMAKSSGSSASAYASSTSSPVRPKSKSTRPWSWDIALAVVAVLVLALMVDSSGQWSMVAALQEFWIVVVLALLHAIFSMLRDGNKPKVPAPKKLAPASDDDDDTPSASPITSSSRSPAWRATGTAKDKEEGGIGQMTVQLRGAVRKGDFSQAELLMDSIKETSGRPGAERPSCWHICYSELVGAFCKSGNLERAEHWLKDYVAGAPLLKPTATSVNQLISAYAARGEAEQAEGWLTAMRSMGLQPDHKSYTTVVDALARSKSVEKAIIWLGQMRGAGLKPALDSYMLVQLTCAQVGADGTTTAWLMKVIDEDQGIVADDAAAPPPPPPPAALAPTPPPAVKRKPQTLDSSLTQASEWPSPVGAWVGEGKGESYEVWATGKDSYACARNVANGYSKEFTLWYDTSADCYWWGTDKKFFFDASQLSHGATCSITWYNGQDWYKQWPAFEWSRPKP